MITSREKFRISNLFLPHQGYIVTPFLITVNIAVYLWMVLSGTNPWVISTTDMYSWGASLRVSFTTGEYWRLLTSCFIHNGLLHLILNMPELLYIGFVLEKRIGSRYFLFAWLLTGITSSLISVACNDSMISAGSSGAILGMYGVFIPLLLSPTFIEKNTRLMLSICTGVLVTSNLLSGFEVRELPGALQDILGGETDDAAHISGFLTGGVMGYLFLLARQSVTRQKLYKILQWTVPVLLTGIIFIVVYHLTDDQKNRSSDLALRSRLEEIEQRAVLEYQPENDTLYDLRIQEGKAYKTHIDTCVTLICDYLASPETDFASQVEFRQLLEYFELRISFNEEYELYLSHDLPEEYVHALEKKQVRINSLLDEINGETESNP